LKVCFAASEAMPLAKTGGLADVAGALPRYLRALGVDVRLFLPFHSLIDRAPLDLIPLGKPGEVVIRLGSAAYPFTLWRSRLPESEVPVYLGECPELFDRPALYTADADEGQRYAAFCRAVLETCQRLAWAPDIFHCHDWHTGLVPVLLSTSYAWDSLFRESRTVLTIHNLGYQGVFEVSDPGELGLGDARDLLDAAELAEGRVGFLRTGIRHAGAITTVSPTYAREIQSEPFGMGLHELLRERSSDIVGILNGVEYDEWSPERDRWIPHRYSRKRPEGKARNKRYLSESLGLRHDGDVPLAGMVTRLDSQKGLELCFPTLPTLVEEGALRVAVLGRGDPKYVKLFEGLARRHPDRVAFRCDHDEELAHVIEAGADLFLMPSRYEPCGLNQMFSLRYGTIPVVRRTGGLADTVEPFDAATGEGTGFVFDAFTAAALEKAIREALTIFRDAAAWRRLISNAMGRNFSWQHQAGAYRALYESVVRGEPLRVSL
jgi:starch synthase